VKQERKQHSDKYSKSQDKVLFFRNRLRQAIKIFDVSINFACKFEIFPLNQKSSPVGSKLPNLVTLGLMNDDKEGDLHLFFPRGEEERDGGLLLVLEKLNVAGSVIRFSKICQNSDKLLDILCLSSKINSK